MKINENMKFIELFAGIGGFRLALERQGHTCVWSNEIDKHAVNIYNNYFGENNEPTDIKTVKIKDIPDHDMLVGGFPCQAFSIAGKRGGFEDTRGTLFFEIARILKGKQPRMFLLENVKGLLNHDRGKTFTTILKTIDELGYDAEWQVLNSKHFGVPQNRERVFIIGYLRTVRGHRSQIFPINESNKLNNEECEKQIARTVTASYYKQGQWEQYINEPRAVTPNRLKRQNSRRFKKSGEPMFITAQDRHGILQMNNPKHSNNRVYSEKGVSPTLNCMEGGNRQPFIKIYNLQQRSENRPSCLKAREQGLPAPGGSGILSKYDETYCLDTSCGQGIEIDSRIRRLTPKECYRLQGFGWKEGSWNDTFYEKARKVASDTQIYKTAGNAVTVNVVESIIKGIK